MMENEKDENLRMTRKKQSGEVKMIESRRTARFSMTVTNSEKINYETIYLVTELDHGFLITRIEKKIE